MPELRQSGRDASSQLTLSGDEKVQAVRKDPTAQTTT
jgi:hypothetical protein